MVFYTPSQRYGFATLRNSATVKELAQSAIRLYKSHEFNEHTSFIAHLQGTNVGVRVSRNSDITHVRMDVVTVGRKNVTFLSPNNFEVAEVFERQEILSEDNVDSTDNRMFLSSVRREIMRARAYYNHSGMVNQPIK